LIPLGKTITILFPASSGIPPKPINPEKLGL